MTINCKECGKSIPVSTESAYTGFSETKIVEVTCPSCGKATSVEVKVNVRKDKP
jgi:endogenous inhibitor of DNA gyrase (YacG/DUF329 family)